MDKLSSATDSLSPDSVEGLVWETAERRLWFLGGEKHRFDKAKEEMYSGWSKTAAWRRTVRPEHKLMFLTAEAALTAAQIYSSRALWNHSSHTARSQLLNSDMLHFFTGETNSGCLQSDLTHDSVWINIHQQTHLRATFTWSFPSLIHL